MGEVGAHVASAVLMGIIDAGERDAEEAFYHSELRPSAVITHKIFLSAMAISMKFLARNGRRGKL